MINSPNIALDQKKAKVKYSEVWVIVLDDSFDTFQHVANSLLTSIQGISKKIIGPNNQSR